MYQLANHSQVIDQNQRIPSPKYDSSEPDIAVSYYHIDHLDQRKKVWVRAPFKEEFVIEEPYHGDDRFTLRDGLLFKIPQLKRINDKNEILMAVLWLKDHQIYTDQLVKSGYEFYRCIGKEGSDYNWILIPLYSKRDYKEVRNPILLYHAENFSKTLIIKNEDIFSQLVSMFIVAPRREWCINAFRLVINGKMKWMVQFPPEGPAMFL